VLIDPSGKIVGYHSGEGIYEIFDRAIEGVIRTAEAKGTLKRGAPNFRLERDKEPRTALRFPGKVLADERTNRLFIADSNHHRILVVSLKDNRVEMVIGAGTPGFRDGAFEAAQFNDPQGMAYDPDADALYIADTDNHAIRKADLRKRTVETLAGTGEQSRAYPPRAGKGTRNRAQLAVGLGAARRYALHRDGRLAPALATEPEDAGGGAARGHGARGVHRRQPAHLRTRPTVGHNNRRQEALLCRQRGQLHSRRRCRPQRHAGDARRGRPVRVRRCGRLRARGAPAAPARCGLCGRHALCRRHLQQQNQAVSPPHAQD
jgi:hypothetical protein